MGRLGPAELLQQRRGFSQLRADVPDELEAVLPEVEIGSEASLGAQLVVGRPDGVRVGEDDKAFADIIFVVMSEFRGGCGLEL